MRAGSGRQALLVLALLLALPHPSASQNSPSEGSCAGHAASLGTSCEALTQGDFGQLLPCCSAAADSVAAGCFCEALTSFCAPTDECWPQVELLATSGLCQGLSALPDCTAAPDGGAPASDDDIEWPYSAPKPASEGLLRDTLALLDILELIVPIPESTDAATTAAHRTSDPQGRACYLFTKLEQSAEMRFNATWDIERDDPCGTRTGVGWCGIVCAREGNPAPYYFGADGRDDPIGAAGIVEEGCCPGDAPCVATIELDGRGLEGVISPRVADLKCLRILNVGQHFVKSKYAEARGEPSSLPDVVWSMTQLTILKFQAVYFKEGMYSLDRIKGLTNLVQVNAEQSPNLIGSIPRELSRLRSLDFFQAGFSGLTGTIPDELSVLTNLKVFNIDQTKVGGTLPASFSEFEQIWELALLGPALSDDEGSSDRWKDGHGITFHGTIPEQWSTLKKLARLRLGSNNLTGTIPAPWLREMEMFECGDGVVGSSGEIRWDIDAPEGVIVDPLYIRRTLFELKFASNRLSGPNPLMAFAGRHPPPCRLQALDASDNALTGTIPPEVGGMVQLKELILSGNRLTGTLPQEVGSAPRLEVLLLDNNNFDGVVPSRLGSAPALEELRISNNDLVGPLPVFEGDVTLAAANNPRLCGEVYMEGADFLEAALQDIEERKQLADGTSLGSQCCKAGSILTAELAEDIPVRMDSCDTGIQAMIAAKDPTWNLVGSWVDSCYILDEGGVSGIENLVNPSKNRVHQGGADRTEEILAARADGRIPLDYAVDKCCEYLDQIFGPEGFSPMCSCDERAVDELGLETSTAYRQFVAYGADQLAGIIDEWDDVDAIFRDTWTGYMSACRAKYGYDFKIVGSTRVEEQCPRVTRFVPTCTSCVAGETYNLRPDGGGSSCQPCPLNATACEGPGEITCPLGQAVSQSPDLQSATCQLCPGAAGGAQGTVGYDGKTCHPCPTFGICEREGEDGSTIRCDPGYTPQVLDGRPGCSRCGIGTYNLDGGKECHACPKGARCGGGSELLADEGYWRSGPTREIMYRCPAASDPYCTKEDREAVGWQACRLGHVGVLCATCAEGYAMEGLYCASCGDAGGRQRAGSVALAISIVVVLAIVLFVSAFWRPFLSQEEDRAKDAIRRFLGQKGRLTLLSRSVSVVRRFIILLSFYQIIQSFGHSFEVAWPASFIDLLSGIAFLNLDVLRLPSFACAAQGLNFYDRFVANIAGTVALMGCMGGVYLAGLVLHRRATHAMPVWEDWQERRGWLRRYRDPEAFEAFQRACTQNALFALVLLYPPLSATCLALFSCREVEGTSYLTADYTITCYDATHRRYMVAAGIGVLVFPIGIPAMILGVLAYYRVPQIARARKRAAVQRFLLGCIMSGGFGAGVTISDLDCGQLDSLLFKRCDEVIKRFGIGGVQGLYNRLTRGASTDIGVGLPGADDELDGRHFARQLSLEEHDDAHDHHHPKVVAAFQGGARGVADAATIWTQESSSLEFVPQPSWGTIGKHEACQAAMRYLSAHVLPEPAASHGRNETTDAGGASYQRMQSKTRRTADRRLQLTKAKSLKGAMKVRDTFEGGVARLWLSISAESRGASLDLPKSPGPSFARQDIVRATSGIPRATSGVPEPIIESTGAAWPFVGTRRPRAVLESAATAKEGGEGRGDGDGDDETAAQERELKEYLVGVFGLPRGAGRGSHDSSRNLGSLKSAQGSLKNLFAGAPGSSKSLGSLKKARLQRDPSLAEHDPTAHDLADAALDWAMGSKRVAGMVPEVGEAHAVTRVWYLINDYRSDCWWFTLLDLLYRLLMTSLLVFAGDGTASRVLLGLVVAVLNLYWYQELRPYSVAENNTMHVLTLLSTVFILVCALCLYVEIVSAEARDRFLFQGTLVVLGAGVAVLPFVEFTVNLSSGVFRVLRRKQQGAVAPSASGDVEAGGGEGDLSSMKRIVGGASSKSLAHMLVPQLVSQGSGMPSVRDMGQSVKRYVESIENELMEAIGGNKEEGGE
eukprot:CAMPEP_0182870958 /NCGR_PEP_ID=MMETSP0034_2-20130328/10835_1 /TAXON_ID=156128 /ORGANISM="Nephroselmis pyriformis, Strain CCMP717" /LENGTH=1996 /DNA_ID=CAMNT_0025003475 /DNA_START=11 /DNA_END=6001 /DNA_ORIENTATION=-